MTSFSLLIICFLLSTTNGLDSLDRASQQSRPMSRKSPLRASSRTRPHGPYTPDWASLDARPLPSWYDEAKFGIFIHWGVFSVPSFGSEWFWHNWRKGNPAYVDFMKKNFRPNFQYADFASEFSASFYNPDEWADIIKASGAKYVVLTSKHHEGFTNWPSNHSFNWNSMDVGPKRDLVGDLAKSIRKRTDVHFGLYHSLYEWFNPWYMQDQANNYTTQTFVKYKTMPELYEIVKAYKPEVIWSDGETGPDTYWKSREFLAWLYNESPVKDTVVVNDRWCSECLCKHGGFLTCHDSYMPDKVPKRKWESCMTIDSGSWGYRRNTNLADYQTTHALIKTLVKVVSFGGNLLLNVGPTKDGIILPIFEERLRQIGDWLKVNGEAIYSSKPWQHQNDTLATNVWYTSKKNPQGGADVYVFVLDWPSNNTLKLGAPIPDSQTKVTMLGYPGEVTWSRSQGTGITVTFPVLNINQLPSKEAWVLKLQNVTPA